MSSEVNGLPLERGAAGEAVRDLQHRLISRGHAVDPAELGVFATSTEAAVSAFQQACGLRPNGRCDDATWSSLVVISVLLTITIVASLLADRREHAQQAADGG